MPCTAMFEVPTSAPIAWTKGGPVEVPILPGEVVPLANKTVIALHGVPSIRSFCVSEVKTRGRMELKALETSRGNAEAKGTRPTRRRDNCILSSTIKQGEVERGNG